MESRAEATVDHQTSGFGKGCASVLCRSNGRILQVQEDLIFNASIVEDANQRPIKVIWKRALESASDFEAHVFRLNYNEVSFR